MLFGYLNTPDQTYQTDVQCFQASVECFTFDRPLLLSNELHIAGAMVFAVSFGFEGKSLMQWALLHLQKSEKTPKELQK